MFSRAGGLRTGSRGLQPVGHPTPLTIAHPFAFRYNTVVQNLSVSTMAEHDCRQALERIIRADERLWSILEAARDCDLPDWFVGAGVIRNVAWDHLHGYREPTPCADVDIAFFDPHDLSPARDRV